MSLLDWLLTGVFSFCFLVLIAAAILAKLGPLNHPHDWK